MALKAKHAFGLLENIDNAILDKKIDSYDILFVKDANGKPYIGWIDAQGQKVIIEDKVQIVRVDALPTSDGDENVLYIFENEGYIWDGIQCVPMAKSADLTTLEGQISTLEEQMANKVDAAKVSEMINTAVENVSGGEIVTF